jgi:hypothetical protein
MRQVNSGPIILALQYPELYDDIDELATMGWVTPIWALVSKSRENYALLMPAYLNFNIDRLNHHIDLLDTFLRSANVDVSKWEANSPLNELSALLSELEAQLNPHDHRNLELYRVVEANVRDYSVNLQDLDSMAKLNPSQLIQLADACFDIITQLDSMSPQIITSVS